MKLKDYCRDKAPEVLFTILLLFLLLEFLHTMGNTPAVITLIGVTSAGLMGVKYLVGWYRRKTYFEIIQNRADALKQPWLIAELLPDSYCTEDKIYQELLRKAGSAAIEEIHKMEDEQREYEDYIEEWIHEVKAPITAIQLILENKAQENPVLKKELYTEVSKIENDVERALYYARTEQVYKDYLVQPLTLRSVLLAAINKNRTILMNSSITVRLECEDDLYILGDKKWLIFLISQVLLNAVKYKKENNAQITLTAVQEDKKVVLKIVDNGSGIKEEDLPRIFDKGFTGSNGRETGKSTGMGLYLVQKLCSKLEIDIWAKSSYGVFTEIYFSFPQKRR